MVCSLLRSAQCAVVTSAFLIGPPEGVEQFTETHEIGLFTREEYLEVFRRCGSHALTGRGLYIGRK